MPPADTERMARRVRIYLMAFVGVQIARLEQSGTERDRLFVRSSGILDVEV